LIPMVPSQVRRLVSWKFVVKNFSSVPKLLGLGLARGSGFIGHGMSATGGG
jgi:hypothetical protein